ncbi:MAG TPA: DNA recombination protein RmuC [Thermoanaerobaculia bacterium]|nr:DNA recombination protein RmuC [Thermoanaerobaculia bacterium]
MIDPGSSLIYAAVFAGGFALAWLVVSGRRSGRVHRIEAERDHARSERLRLDAALGSTRQRLEQEQQLRTAAETRCGELQRRLEETGRFVEDARRQLEGTYAQLSQTALGEAVQQLLNVVKPHLDGARGDIVSSLDTKKVEIEALVAPLRETLDAYQVQLQRAEQDRARAFSGLTEQLRQLHTASESATKEASRLATALRAPQVSGSWGENTLRRCAELAGMSAFCDFEWQYSLETEDSRRYRPDMIVRLPDDRVIAVDAKAPLEAYLAATGPDVDDRRRRELLQQHAATLRRHVDSLSRKEYQEHVQRTLGTSLSFTILFISGEHFLSAAMITDPSIFEYASGKNVVLASPTILVPLLKALASGWKAEELEENARKAMNLAQELYQRFGTFIGHFDDLRRSLDKSIESYNAAVRSFDTRLVPKVRELEKHIGSSRVIEEIRQIDKFALEASRIPELPEGEDDLSGEES